MNSHLDLKLTAGNKYKRKWFLLAIVWIIAMCLFLWNMNRIDSYYKERDKIMAMKEIDTFINAHRIQLKKVMKERNKLYDHVPSAKIGILKLQEILAQLAKENNLSISHMEEETSQEVGSIGLNLLCEGSINGFARMLSSLLNTYPYVQIKYLRIRFVENKNGKYEIKLVYNCIIDKN